MHKNTTDASEVTRYPASTTENNSDNSNDANAQHSGQSSYRQLWLEASDKLDNKESVNELFDRILLVNPENRLCKIVYPQERVISHFEKMNKAEFTPT